MANLTRIPPTTDAHRTRDHTLLRHDITIQEMVDHNQHDGHLHHEKWIVDAQWNAKPQYGAPNIVTVWSPCCGRPRQRIQHGYAFSCPACGWWWRYHGLGWTCRFVSLGKTRPREEAA